MFFIPKSMRRTSFDFLKIYVHRIMETSITRPTLEDRAVPIYGSTGQIRICFPTCAPHRFYVTDNIQRTGDIRKPSSGRIKPVEKIYEFSIPGMSSSFIRDLLVSII